MPAANACGSRINRTTTPSATTGSRTAASRASTSPPAARTVRASISAPRPSSATRLAACRRHAANLVALLGRGAEIDALTVLAAGGEVEALEAAVRDPVVAEGVVVRLILDPHAFAAGMVEIVVGDQHVAGP